MKKQLFIILFFGTVATFAQTTSSKIGSNPYTINPSAILELESVSKGLLLPRLTTSQRDAIVAPAEGLIIYNSTTKQLETNKGTSAAPIWSGADVPDATTSVKGKIKLANDLGGTADAPTVPGLATKESTIAPGATTDYWRGDKTWQPLTKTSVGLGNVDNTSDLNKPISTATQTALNLKEDVANKSTSIATDATSTTKYPSVKVIKDYVDAQVASATIPDATATVKGKLQLAGDLAGTAAAPSVVKLQGNSVSATAPTSGQLLAWNATTSAWEPGAPAILGNVGGKVQIANNVNTATLNNDTTILIVTGTFSGNFTLNAPSNPYPGKFFWIVNVNDVGEPVNFGTPSASTNNGKSRMWVYTGTQWQILLP